MGFLVAGGISIILVPFVSPYVSLFYVVRTVLQCAMAPIVVNPFVNDYVTVQMRGAGVGLQGMGMTFGNILSTAILFTITLQMGEISKFLLLGGLNFVWIAIIWGFGLIVEPSIN